MDIAMAVGNMRQLDADRSFQREEAKREWTEDRAANLLLTEKRKVFFEVWDNDPYTVADLVAELIYCKGSDCDELRSRLKLLMNSQATGMATREADRKEERGFWSAI